MKFFLKDAPFSHAAKGGKGGRLPAFNGPLLKGKHCKA